MSEPLFQAVEDALELLISFFGPNFEQSLGAERYRRMPLDLFQEAVQNVASDMRFDLLNHLRHFDDPLIFEEYALLCKLLEDVFPESLQGIKSGFPTCESGLKVLLNQVYEVHHPLELGEEALRQLRLLQSVQYDSFGLQTLLRAHGDVSESSHVPYVVFEFVFYVSVFVHDDLLFYNEFQTYKAGSLLELAVFLQVFYVHPGFEEDQAEEHMSEHYLD